MQIAMRQKLISARFRHLNETLYTAPSTTSLALFADNPEMFDDYHSGFRQQVTTWPENPVDIFIRSIRDRAKVKVYNQNKAFRDVKRGKAPKEEEEPATGEKANPLPRTHGTCNIADLGCGDARLAATFHEDGSGTRYNLKIASYDLQSPSKFVTKADIANLPCADGSMDVAIFCLALMGTNWIDFIEEAYRILHWKGELWISEIKSRFGRVGGDKGKGGQKVVEHSVGNRRKAAAKAKAADATRAKLTAEEEEAALREHVDEVVTTSNAETDVSGFVEVLRRRGFVLKDENSVDLSNKMFVKMEFIKAAEPVVGKNVREAGAERKPEPGTWAPKFKKFVEPETKEVSVADETKTLKPCLYKIR
jgi:ribosomal RNA-processing protein 8